MDPRLTVRFGRRGGKETIVKSPCVDEVGKCRGCPKQFTPVPPESDNTYCLVYLDPVAKWIGKTCPFMYKAPSEKEQKMNPIKASKRGIRQVSQVAIATGSKEAAKKNKKKNKERTERRDSR